jgi:hypothetical protein
MEELINKMEEQSATKAKEFEKLDVEKKKLLAELKEAKQALEVVESEIPPHEKLSKLDIRKSDYNKLLKAKQDLNMKIDNNSDRLTEIRLNKEQMNRGTPRSSKLHRKLKYHLNVKLLHDLIKSSTTKKEALDMEKAEAIIANMAKDRLLALAPSTPRTWRYYIDEVNTFLKTLE